MKPASTQLAIIGLSDRGVAYVSGFGATTCVMFGLVVFGLVGP